MAGSALLHHVSALDDPRQLGKVLYPLPEVMLLYCARRLWVPRTLWRYGCGAARSWRSSAASRQRLVLGQQAVDTESNEIIAIPLLLARLHVNGALVTIDAMECQTKVAQRKAAGWNQDYLRATITKTAQ